MTKRIGVWLAAGLLAGLALICCQPAAAGGDALPSWQGPVKQQLLSYVQAVAEPGGAEFIPPAERIAAFDLDGTLMAERPLPFVMELSLTWLRQNCPGFARKGPRQAALCAAAVRGERRRLFQNIEDLLALPFDGWDLDAYRQKARRFFKTHPNPAKKLPYSRLIYQPQRELIALLLQKEFSVWICSGSAITAIQAISADSFGVAPEHCIGTRYTVRVGEEHGRLVFKRGEVLPGLVNLDKVKAENLKLATVHGPVLAFGNSDGDAWMLRFAADSPRRGLALVLNHDDPREFVYAKPDLLELARRRGWTAVSMRRAWKRVFAP